MKTKQRIDFAGVLVIMSLILCLSYSCKSHKNLQPKSTIDNAIQTYAESKLKEYMELSKADWGSLALMNVDSGEIKALVNLKRDTSNNVYFQKTPNYAATKLIEPGQLFTLASLMACLQDDLIYLTDSVSIGTTLFSEIKMIDSDPTIKRTTIQKAFEISSNVAIAKLVTANYKNSPERFVKHLKDFMIDKPLGLIEENEPKPILKDVTSPTWSKVTLPWLAIGYEIRMTPLQILAFYNAIANNGK
ncbi:MAG: penicillin-binding transpeptidase domain-containing protein, partial [Bacteroidota bacterium]